MKNRKSLVVKILVLSASLTFSACQKSAAENIYISPSPAISPAPTAKSTPAPNSPIRKVDFKNFKYQWTEDLSSKDEKTFTLKKGERPFVKNGQMGVLFENAEYGDVTNDGEEEAFVNLSVETGGSSIPNMIYIYSLKDKKPELLWSFETGDRAQGGFKKIYAENGELVVETFGENKFEKDKWEFSFPKKNAGGYCCPTAYTKIRFKWNGEKFVTDGAPELFDYDWKNKKEEN